MAVDDPWAIDGLALSALEWRRGMSGLLIHDSNPVSARPGVLSGCAVSVATLTATVSAGQLVVTPQPGSNGSYFVGLTATDVTIAARDATFGRIDRIIARIYDDSIDGSGQSKAAIEILTGTPAGSPTAPTLPSGTVEIAQLQVPASSGGSIVVVDKRPFTAAAGGVLPAASRAVLTAMTAPQVGQVAVCLDYGTMWRWNGTQWHLINSPRFANVPERDVVLTGASAGWMCSTGTAATFTVWVHTGSGWVALGPNSTTGWLSLSLESGFAGSCVYRQNGQLVELRCDITGTVGSSNTPLTVTLPAAYRPATDGTTLFPLSAYIDPASARAASTAWYAGDTATVRASSGGGSNIARVRGRVTWMLG